MSLCSLDRHQHLVRDAQKCLSVLDRRIRPHTYKAAFEIGWIVYLWLLDTVCEAPVIKDLALALVLDLPSIYEVRNLNVGVIC